ncbi:hypothetical protein ACP4OV_013238 [Aristida adscensionis]
MGSTAPNWLGFTAADDVLRPPPKLEDFLGAQEPAAAAGRPVLSMIKNWLRSQPAPAGAEAESDAMALAMAPAAAAPTDGSGKQMAGDGVESGGGAQRKAPVDTFGQRTSIYRGVTKHRWTGRYEAHLWDNSCRREGQTRKGRQVYLGGYDKEEKAARAYDLAALKYWGPTTTTNFPVTNYEKELEEMKQMNRQEYVASLRRKSSGFSRGASIYRGVTRHHQHGRWQARIGRVAGNKDLYLGTFSTQEEAAEAYDIAAIKFRGLNAVTNFDMSRYDVKSIIESSSLPVISGTRNRTKDVPDHLDTGMDSNGAGNGHMAAASNYDYGGRSSPAAFTAIPLQQCSNGNGYSRMWCKTEAEQDGVPIATAAQNLQHFAGMGSTHNFFQPSGSDHYQLAGYVDVSLPSVENSQTFFHNGAVVGFPGAMSGGGGYAMPVATLVEHGQDNDSASRYGEDYGGRSMYYLSQESPGSTSTFEQGIRCDGWVSPELVVTQKPTSVTVCQQLPLLSWK